jgi:hypothetical protein
VKLTKTQTSKKERRESKNPDTTGSMRGVEQRKFRRTWKGECKRKKNDSEIQIWKRGERKQVLDRKRGKKVQNVL